MASTLRTIGESIEAFLARAGFDRAPWLVVAFAAGIAAWFTLPTQSLWLSLLAVCGVVLAASLVLLKAEGRYPYARQALAGLTLALGLGCGHVWLKSELVGAAPISRPQVAILTGTVLDRQEQPAEERVRLVLATRDPESGRAIKARINVPLSADDATLRAGAVVRDAGSPGSSSAADAARRL